MKKYLIVFLILTIGPLIYLLINEKKFPTSLPDNSFSENEFVSLKDGKFSLNGKEFFPLVLNYVVDFHTNGNEIWTSPSVSYYNDSIKNYEHQDSSLHDIKKDFSLIRELGFNTVRFGAGSLNVDENKRIVLLKARNLAGGNEYLDLTQENIMMKYLQSIDDILKIAADQRLHIILILRDKEELIHAKIPFENISHYFKNDPTILAYDLFNEPLYFYKIERQKKEIYNISKNIYKRFKKISPKHLLTIGLVGIREVFTWDPNILTIDFVSFHPYEYEPEQVRNEIYWYGKYVKKPWIIGETAIPADNDSIPYEDQKTFAINTIKQTINCGAIGYSWWQYKDVEWNIFHQNYMGVVARDGITELNNGLKVMGKVKPVVEAFKNIDLKIQSDSCLTYGNYYNYSEGTAFKIIGKVIDSHTQKPILGGVILAWNEWWTSSYHTVTKPDGTFELLSTFPLYHWMASATTYSRVRGDINPDTAKSSIIPTINLGVLEIEHLKID